MRVAAHHQAFAQAGAHDLDQAVRRVAQAHGTAHVQQALEGRQQHFGGRKDGLAMLNFAHGRQRMDVQGLQHFRGKHPARFGGRAVHQNRHAFTRQQQGQQGREHRQLACAVVAGQHHGGGLRCGEMREALVQRVEEARHLFGRFALDAHGQAKAADFEVGHRAVQHLAHQVGGLRARQRAGAVLAAADFLDVLANTHKS
jgi:hypothetical protein